MDEEALSDTFSALGDVRRLRALRYIADRSPGREGGGEEAVCACHVQEHLGLSQPATSYHLGILREADLVSGEKRGRWVHYRVSAEGIDVLGSFLAEVGEAVPVPSSDAA